MYYKKYDQLAFVQAWFGIAALMTCGMIAAGCGTTSKIKPATSQSEPSPTIDFSRYQRVIVMDFVDAVSSKKKGYKREKHAETMKKVVSDFAEMIAAELREKTGFLEITRNTHFAYPDTLVIRGQITKYEEGDSALRMFIGFGAGSAKFDATVQFLDGTTGTLLGVVEVDKNSWALGGAIAATQSAEKFMEEASKKIASHFEKSHPKGETIAYPLQGQGIGYPSQGASYQQTQVQTAPAQTVPQATSQRTDYKSSVPPVQQPSWEQIKYE